MFMKKKLLLYFLLIACCFANYTFAQSFKQQNNQDTLKDLSVDVYLFSRIMQSPLFSLPLERSLAPLFGYAADDCQQSYLALTPFAQTGDIKLTKENCFFYEQNKGGFLIKGRYSFKDMWIDVTTACEVVSTEIERMFPAERAHTRSIRVGIDDIVLTLGTESWLNPYFYANLKGILALCGKNRDFFDFPFGAAAHNGIGLASDMLYTFYQSNQAKCNLVGTVRWLNFLKRELEGVLTYVPTRHKIDLGNCALNPGNFFDVLIGADFALGCDYQHRLQTGYDVMFNRGQALDNFSPVVNLHFINPAPQASHTVYGFYTYDVVLRCCPFSIGLGASATFSSHESTKGLVWLLASIQF